MACLKLRHSEITILRKSYVQKPVSHKETLDDRDSCHTERVAATVRAPC